MKKIIKFIILPVLVISCALLICACQKPEDKITIYTPFKTEYLVGEELDVTGGILNYTKNGTTTQVVVTEDMIQNFSSTSMGTFTLIIEYEGCTTTLQYIVEYKFNVSYTNIYIGTNSIIEGSYYCLTFFPNNTIGLDCITTGDKEDAFFPPQQTVSYTIEQDGQGYYAVTENFSSEFSQFAGAYLKLYDVTPTSVLVMVYMPSFETPLVTITLTV
ncbi:MAG: hypothetical protein E7376_05370 [Clostridiales bacterium]|nr:hypothetical protein [Clostridiales bacterium]